MSGGGRRKRGGGGHAGGGGHGGWLVTYADLLTLLMVVFLVLWVIAQIDLAKFEKFKEGLGDFGNPAAEAATSQDGSTEAGGTGDGDGDTKVDPYITSAGELTTEGLSRLESTVQEAISLAGLPDIISVSQDDRGLVITVSTDDILFEAGSADLGPAGMELIGTIAPALDRFNNHILVEGHTDKRPLKRAGYDNWDLSVDRAVNVVKLLKDIFGLDASQLAATGYGAERPIALGDDPESLAKNRRIEIVVLAGTEPVAPSTTVAPTATPQPGQQPADSEPVDGIVLVPGGTIPEDL